MIYYSRRRARAGSRSLRNPSRGHSFYKIEPVQNKGKSLRFAVNSLKLKSRISMSRRARRRLPRIDEFYSPVFEYSGVFYVNAYGRVIRRAVISARSAKVRVTRKFYSEKRNRGVGSSFLLGGTVVYIKASHN